MKDLDLHDRPLIGEAFKNRRLIFTGEPLSIQDVVFSDCTFQFTDHAARTVRFLQSLYKANGNGALLVEALFQSIRDGSDDTPRFQ